MRSGVNVPFVLFWLAIIAMVLLPYAVLAAEDSFADWIDEQDLLRQRIASVNEGSLEFLDAPPEGEVHHHAGKVVISERSLMDGWVLLEQCHVNLDQVSAAQILFNPRSSRDLSVISYRNIEQAFAEKNTIQLRGIGADSEVCVRAESRALHQVDDGVYELKNGPFMRRFLDGYYPLRLSLQVAFPKELAFADHEPAVQPGFVVVASSGLLDIEALFEGELRTAFRFLRQ